MKVVILVPPEVQLLDVAGPMDVFCEANKMTGDKVYEVRLVGMNPELSVAANGMRFLADYSINTLLPEIDTLLIAGSPYIQKYEHHELLLQWIKHHAPLARRIGSICTGAFLLANAGYLDGRQVTTHWNSTSRLAQNYPNIKVEPNRIYVKDQTIFTSAGVTASMDLALALVEEDLGRKLALKIAKHLILFLKRPGGQSQFSMQLAAQIANKEPIRELQEWILEHLSAHLSVDNLAEKAGMSPRNFARVFKHELGITPGDFVEIARVEAAQRLLEEGDTPLKKVASLCGFSDANSLRRAFFRRMNVTPHDYRQRFLRTS